MSAMPSSGLIFTEYVRNKMKLPFLSSVLAGDSIRTSTRDLLHEKLTLQVFNTGPYPATYWDGVTSTVSIGGKHPTTTCGIQACTVPTLR